jgi:hypothetical protein
MEIFERQVTVKADLKAAGVRIKTCQLAKCEWNLGLVKRKKPTRQLGECLAGEWFFPLSLIRSPPIQSCFLIWQVKILHYRQSGKCLKRLCTMCFSFCL